MSAAHIPALVNMTPAFPDLEELDHANRPEIAEKVAWLKKHPGRWALVGESSDGMLRGFTNRTAQNHGLRGMKRSTGTTIWHYASYPLADGATLEETLLATEWLRPFYPEDLPDLLPDPFGWTPAELAAATAQAAALRRKVRRKPRKIAAWVDESQVEKLLAAA